MACLVFSLMATGQKKVLHNLIEAHVQAYNKITEVDDIYADEDGVSKRIGFTHLMMAITTRCCEFKYCAPVTVGNRR